MSTNSQLKTITSVLFSTFKSCLEVCDAVELSDCIDEAQVKALKQSFTEQDIPLVFTGQARDLTKRSKPRKG